LFDKIFFSFLSSYPVKESEKRRKENDIEERVHWQLGRYKRIACIQVQEKEGETDWLTNRKTERRRDEQ